MNTATEVVDEIAGASPGPRRKKARIVILVGMALALVLAASWAFWPRGQEHRLIYTKSLGDGRVFKCYTDGSVLGSEGTETRVEDPPGSEGGEGGPAIVVRPPDLNEEEAKRAEEAYRSGRRSFEQDKADFERLSKECRSRR